MKIRMLVIATFAACAPLSYAAEANIVDYQPGISLGYGYDALSGKFTGPCYTGSSKPTFFAEPIGNLVWGESITRDSLRRSLNMSVSASYDGEIASASGKVSYENLFTAAKSVVTISARNNLVIGFETLTDKKEILPDGASVLTRDVLSMRQRCGTHYVQSINYGGELFAILKQDVKSQSERDQFALDAKASGITFSGDTSIRSKLEESIFESTVEIHASYAGGNEVNLMSPAELRAQFSQFRQHIARQAAQSFDQQKLISQPVSVVLVEIMPSGDDADKLAALSDAMKKLSALEDYQDAVLDIARRPSLYNVSIEDLNDNASKIDTRINALVGNLRQQMRQCSTAASVDIPVRCNFSAFPMIPAVPDSDLPALYRDACGRMWTPPPTASEFQVLRRLGGDDSMGGSDAVRIGVTYSANANGPLRQSVSLRIWEARGDTSFGSVLDRVFFDATVSPPPGCYIKDAVQLSDPGGSVGIGSTANNYRDLTFNTAFVSGAICRSNQSGGDSGYVGCRKITFKPIALPLAHIEKLDGTRAIPLVMPPWLK